MNNLKEFNFIIDESSVNERIDSFLSKKTEISRTTVQNLIKNGNVLVNENETKNNYKVQLNDDIYMKYEVINDDYKIEPVKMDLDIVYEDDDLIVINKPKGLVVHPGAGNYENTLVHGLLYHCKTLSDTNGDIRPGIVHRIDKDTSGLLVCAKNNETHVKLAKQLEDKTCFRKYYAIVNGVIESNEGIIDAPIGRDKNNRQKMCVCENGKKAITLFKVLKRFNDSTLVDLELKTGRTHQIRVHMAYIRHYVLNDEKYGHKLIDDTGQYLHAYYLSFIHPRTNKRVEFTCDMPGYMTNYINEKEKKYE